MKTIFSRSSKSRSNGIEFKLYKKRAGHPVWKEVHEEAVELAAKVRQIIRKDSDITRLEKAKDARRKARAMKLNLENYIINRRRMKEGNHALRPMYAIWTMLNACNFRCTYCDNHQGEHYFDIPDPDRLDTAQGRKLLDAIYTGTPAIYWCGGEPTMRTDLPELLDYAWNKGFFPNMINTNGALLNSRLMKPEWKNFLRQMDVIIVSVDGLNLEMLNGLWGVKAARQVMVNLLMLRELRKDVNFKLAVNTVITPDTIDEARSVLDLACDLDLWFAPVPVNFKHGPNKSLLDNPKYRKLAETMLERKKKGAKLLGSHTLLKRLLYAEPYKCFTALKPHIWSNGEICWPCRASINVKPVNMSLLEHGSFDAAYEAGSKLVSPDYFHGPAVNQCGGDCAWMQNYTTSRYMDGLIKPLRSGILSEIFEFTMNRKNL
jgi:MoaA/NifB/PqqE/SkfB family radical SAM enzyme